VSGLALLVAGLLLLGNGFFVGSEFALIAARRTRLEPLAAQGSTRAVTVLRAMGQIPLMVAGAQLGITICSLGLGAVAEPAVAHLIEVPFAVARVAESLVHPVAFVLALGLVVFAHTVIGEMVPKNIALAGAEQAALWLGPPMLWFCMMTKPLLSALQWASAALLRLWGIQATDAVKTVYTAEELASLVTESRTEGLLDADDHRRITGALTLTERTAAEVMTPWSRVRTVPRDVTPAAVETLAVRTRLSRFPVVDRQTRAVVGFVHVKDMLWVEGPARQVPIPPTAIRPLTVVRPDATLAELLLAMRRTHSHLVLVSDGARPLGVATLDDVLSAVVGAPVSASAKSAS
jgi:CBS domain containing-hemolysin-like protein